MFSRRRDVSSYWHAMNLWVRGLNLCLQHTLVSEGIYRKPSIASPNHFPGETSMLKRIWGKSVTLCCLLKATFWEIYIFFHGRNAHVHIDILLCPKYLFPSLSLGYFININAWSTILLQAYNKNVSEIQQKNVIYYHPCCSWYVPTDFTYISKTKTFKKNIK